MTDTPAETPAEKPDTERLAKDPDALRESHAKYMGYLKEAGLPFEPEEFDEEDADSARKGEESATPEEE